MPQPLISQTLRQLATARHLVLDDAGNIVMAHPTSARVRWWRHCLHDILELAMRQHRTGDYLAAELRAIGLDVTRGIGGTGLVATLRRRTVGRSRCAPTWTACP